MLIIYRIKLIKLCFDSSKKLEWLTIWNEGSSMVHEPIFVKKHDGPGIVHANLAIFKPLV